MAIDASIYGQIQAPKFESPLNALAQVTQVRNAQNQNRLFDMKVAESERTLAGENALNDAYRGATGADGTIDRNKLYQSIASSGQGAKLPGIQKGLADTDKSTFDAQKSQLDAAGKNAEIVGQYMTAAKQNPALYPQILAQLRAMIPGGGKDLPDQFDTSVVDATITRAMSVKDQIAAKQKELDYQLDQQKFGETVRNNKTQNGIAAGNLGVARQNAATSREKLDFDKSKPGKVANMSATMQKELFEADDTVQASKNVIGLLDQALKLNDKAYSGLGAKERAAVRGQLPGDRSSADATINLDNIMTGQALESLKSVFGGMPTEGERKILLDIQASADKTPSQRKLIIDRARSAAQNRMKFNESKAKSLRDGSYTTTGPAPVEPEPNNIDSLLDKYK